MINVVFAGLSFLLFWFLHIILFRLKLMRFETNRFLALSVVGFLFYLFLSLSSRASSLLICGGLFYFLCFLAYLLQCTAIQVQSPSMTIVQKIGLHPQKRMSFEELKVYFRDEDFIDARLSDLVLYGHLLKEDEHYQLSPRGALIAKVIRTYREVLGQGMGG